jgi:hypothetical protein
MAKTSAEAERERKLLALAAKAEEQAETVGQEAERSQDRSCATLPSDRMWRRCDTRSNM